MIDTATAASIASRYGIPPTLVVSVLQHDIPSQVLASIGIGEADASSNPTLQAEVVARALAQNFKEQGSWDRALAQYYSGSPDTSPTSNAAGLVASTLGQAAVHPMLGMDTFTASNPDMMQRSFTDLAEHWKPFAQQGGIIAQSTLADFSAQVQALARSTTGTGGGGGAAGTTAAPGGGRQASQPRGSSVSPGGGRLGGGDIPGGLVTSKVFGQQYGVTQGFGENGEQGADFATPEGTPVFAGFGGTVHVENYGSGYTGLSIWVDNGQGWQFFAGHMLTAALQPGAHVNAGDVLGTTGGGPQAAALGEQGHSTGSHSEIQIRQVTGPGQYVYHDPATLVANAGKTTGPIGGASMPSSAGFVPDDVVKAAHSAIQTNRLIQQNSTPQEEQKGGQKPQDIQPADIAKFKQEAQAAGVQDPQSIIDHAGFLSTILHKLTGNPPSLMDLARTTDMTPAEVQAWALQQPHPTYPHLSNGQMQSTRDTASLFSAQYLQRMPHDSEVARLAHYNDPKHIAAYYGPQGGGQAASPQPAPPGQNAPQKPSVQDNAQEVRSGGTRKF